MSKVYLQEPPSGRIRAGIRRAFSGDFSKLPADPSFDNFWGLHNALDGYRTAEDAGYGDLAGLGDFANRKTQAFHETGQWTGSALDLWLTLFFNCRAARHSDSLPEESEWRSLYLALRNRLQALPEHELTFIRYGEGR